MKPEQLKLFEVPAGELVDLTYFAAAPRLEIGKIYKGVDGRFQVIGQHPLGYRCVSLDGSPMPWGKL